MLILLLREPRLTRISCQALSHIVVAIAVRVRLLHFVVEVTVVILLFVRWRVVVVPICQLSLTSELSLVRQALGMPVVGLLRNLHQLHIVVFAAQLALEVMVALDHLLASQVVHLPFGVVLLKWAVHW